MSVASRQFLVRISIFSMIIYAIAIALFSTILETWYIAFYPFMIVVIASVTTIGHLWILKASGQNTRKFTTAFMASVTLKILVYLTFILVYLLIDHSQVVSFVLTFTSFYILYTVFEVIHVLDFIKKQSKSV